VTKEQGGQWFSQAVQLLPQASATESDKARLLQVVADVAGRDELKSSIGSAFVTASQFCDSKLLFKSIKLFLNDDTYDHHLS
jgi:hypothetical protein